MWGFRLADVGDFDPNSPRARLPGILNTAPMSGLASIAELITLLLASLTVWVIARFVWRVFLYRYWRANRIRHIRERRDLHDANMR
jgi:hypothetical protein